MSSLYGADVAELRRLSAAFHQAADELDRDGGQLTRLLNGVEWLGGVANRFTSQWTGVQLPRIGVSTRFLRDAADELARNADQQEQASRAVAGGAEPSRPTDPNTPRSRMEAQFVGNERRMREYLEGLRPDDPFRRAVEARLDEEPPRYRLFHFDPSQRYLAWTTANIITASRVIVTVPGTGANWQSVSEDFTTEGDAYLEGHSHDTAVISTMMWDPPNILPQAAILTDDVPTIASGPMPDMLRALHESGRDVVVTGHSAGAAAVQHLFTTNPELVQYVDGVALFAPADFDPDFPDVMDGRPVFIGVHADDPILLTYIEERGEIVGISREENVRFKVESSGQLPDPLNGHDHSRYVDNFKDEVHGLFPDPTVDADGLIGAKVSDSDGNIRVMYSDTF